MKNVSANDLERKKMLCREFSQHQSLYLDDALAPRLRAECDGHLNDCPVCRAELAEERFLIGSLRRLEIPAPPLDFAAMLKQSVAIELAAGREINASQAKSFSWQILWDKYLQPQLVPYATGALATLLLFTMMFISLRNSIEAFRGMEFEARRARLERETLLAETSDLPYEQMPTLPAADYAVRRLSYTADSPSLNPQGTFVALTSSLTRNDSDNQTIMVVADVLSSGIANIADVIQAPREPDKLAALEKMLHDDPAFVPASLDRRPDNVRVVLLIQKVDVPENKSSETSKNSKIKKF